MGEELSFIKKIYYGSILQKLRIKMVLKFKRFASNRQLEKYKNAVIVIGDSHSRFFTGDYSKVFQMQVENEIDFCYNRLFGKYKFEVFHLGPATAYSAFSEDSKTQTKKKTEFIIKEFSGGCKRIVCCLGEIDCRYHILEQARKKNVLYKDIVEDVVNRYLAYLLWIKSYGWDVYVWGPVASISDEFAEKEYFPRVGSMRDRNMVTKYFGERISQLCATNGMHYLSIFDELVDEELDTKMTYYENDGVHLSKLANRLAVDKWKIILNKE